MPSKTNQIKTITQLTETNSFKCSIIYTIKISLEKFPSLSEHTIIRQTTLKNVHSIAKTQADENLNCHTFIK